MNKKLLIGIGILVIVVLIGVIIVASNKPKPESSVDNTPTVEEQNGISKLESIRNKIVEDKNYSYSAVLNDSNYKKIYRNGDYAKIITSDEGVEETYEIKNGNTCVLSTGVEYENNTTMLNEIENSLQNVLKRRFELGTETIENMEYSYEEFSNISNFLINYKGNVDNNNTKTRFYFEGNNLKYIKTYVGKIEQLLKVELENGGEIYGRKQ